MSLRSAHKPAAALKKYFLVVVQPSFPQNPEGQRQPQKGRVIWEEIAWLPPKAPAWQEIDEEK